MTAARSGSGPAITTDRAGADMFRGPSKKVKYTLGTIVDAGRENRLCVALCEDRKTGKRTYVLCETYVKDGAVQYNPVARLFDGNPYNEVTPPGLSADKQI